MMKRKSCKRLGGRNFRETGHSTMSYSCNSLLLLDRFEPIRGPPCNASSIICGRKQPRAAEHYTCKKTQIWSGDHAEKVSPIRACTTYLPKSISNHIKNLSHNSLRKLILCGTLGILRLPRCAHSGGRLAVGRIFADVAADTAVRRRHASQVGGFDLGGHRANHCYPLG